MFSIEHPYSSWMWELDEAIELENLEGVYAPVFSTCCFRGRQKRWTKVLTNCHTLFEALRQPECSHVKEDVDWAAFYMEQW